MAKTDKTSRKSMYKRFPILWITHHTPRCNKDAFFCWCWTRWTPMSAGTTALNRSWDSNLIILGFFFGFTLVSDMVLNLWRGFRLFLWSRWCGLRLFAFWLIFIVVSSFCIRIFGAGRVLVCSNGFLSFGCYKLVVKSPGIYSYIDISIIDLELDWNKMAFDKCRVLLGICTCLGSSPLCLFLCDLSVVLFHSLLGKMTRLVHTDRVN